MKKFIIVFILVSMCLVGVFASGGSEYVPQTADKSMQIATERSMAEANSQVGMPAITRWTEKKLMKMIYELRDKADLICYAYSYSEYTGEYTFIGQCIGYGLPYSVQFSNPDRMNTVDGGEYGARNPYTIGQPEPNGLFMPEGLTATWLMLINPENGEVQPMYMEPSLTVSQFPLPSRICKDGVNK